MVVLFVHKFTAHHMYSANYWDKIWQEVQMQLSYKSKTISQIFIAFSKYTWNVAYLEKKDQLDSSNIWEVIDSKKCAYLNAKKPLFQKTHQESTCSRVPKTAQISATSLLS